MHNSVSIAEVVEKVDKWSPNKEIPEDVFDYIDISSIDRNSKSIEDSRVSRILGKDAPSRARQKVRRNDILISTVRPNLNSVAIVTTEYVNTTASTGLCVLRSNNKVYTKYLYYWLTSDYFVDEMARKAIGANYPAISDTIIKNSKIPLPDVTFQKIVAKDLDKVSKLISRRNLTFKLVDELINSLFIEMFGDPILNNKNWKKVKIESICKIVRGSSPRPKGDPRYYGGNIPRLMGADLTRDGLFVTPRIDFLTAEGAQKSRPIKKGTAVITVSGDVGTCAILEIDACIHDGFVAFKDLNKDLCASLYLVYLMNLLKVTHKKRQAGAIFKNITTTQLKDMSVPLPPMELQIIFKDKIMNILKLKDSMVYALDKIEELKASYMNEYFA